MVNDSFWVHENIQIKEVFSGSVTVMSISENKLTTSGKPEKRLHFVQSQKF